MYSGDRDRVPMLRKLGGPHGRSGQLRKTRSYWDSIPWPASQ